MGTKSKIFYFLLFSLPGILVFRRLLGVAPLYGGDSPYFYEKFYEEVLLGPSVWTSLTGQIGVVNIFLWQYPLLYLYSLFGLNGFSNDFIVLMIFIIPSVCLSLIGIYLLGREFGLSKAARAISSIIYLSNTYFILLVDGGQLGIVLSYGIFPLIVYQHFRFFSRPTVYTFVQSVLLLYLGAIADPRVSVLVFLFLLVWILSCKNWKFIRWIILELVFIFVGLAYFAMPFVKLQSDAFISQAPNLGVAELSHAFFLYQPHWPDNVFGNTSLPQLSFLLYPLLIFVGVIVKPRKNFLLLGIVFLISAFLISEGVYPFTKFYNEVFEILDFLSAYRDSTKFFVPLVLSGALLGGYTVDVVRRLRQGMGNLVLVFSAIYVLHLVLSDVSTRMNFFLNFDKDDGGVIEISETIQNDSGFFRSLWIPERHVLGFVSESKPAVNATWLTQTRPFANMNVGYFNLFNFSEKDRFVDWFRLLGLRYVVFSGNQRVVDLSEDQITDERNFMEAIERTGEFKAGSFESPVYVLDGVYERIFGANKALVVIGSDDVYDKISPLYTPVLFVEDGLLSVESLSELPEESIYLYFNSAHEVDLTMSLLQKYFNSIDNAVKNEWSKWASNEYLQWKYQLLIRDFDVVEVDYGLGVAFSTRKGEELIYEVPTKVETSYKLAIRAMGAGGEIRASVNGKDLIVGDLGSNFSWYIEDFVAEDEKVEIKLINEAGLGVINTIAVIPFQQYANGKLKSEFIMSRFEILEDSDLKKVDNEENIFNIGYEFARADRYSYFAEKEGWLLFTDAYHDKWENIVEGERRISYPFYSMVNGFYVKSGEGELLHGGQNYVRYGLYVSAITVGILTSLLLVKRKK